MLRSSPVCSFFSQNVPVDLATLPFFMLSLLLFFFLFEAKQLSVSLACRDPLTA